jgi:hypothetical protein
MKTLLLINILLTGVSHAYAQATLDVAYSADLVLVVGCCLMFCLGVLVGK